MPSLGQRPVSQRILRPMNKIGILPVLLLALLGCTRDYNGRLDLPLLYKIDIQQGNVIEQEMLDQLRPGLDKAQTRFIMGAPMLIDPFRNNRWEYIYSFQKGGGVREQRHITLHFEDDKLTHISGDIRPATATRRDRIIITEQQGIIVPKQEEKSVFERWWERVTPGD